LDLQIERKKDMSASAYRQAICALANDEMNGEDVEARISYLAVQAKVGRENVRHEVTEAQQD
jgi:hypothetical protein